MNLIKSNEILPDIEKLQRSEFILDLEEHQKHQAEEAEMIAKVSLVFTTLPCIICV